MRQVTISDLQLNPLRGERVNSRSALRIVIEPLVLTPEDEKVARAIPFYPADASVSEIIRKSRCTYAVVAMVLNRVLVCNHFRIAQDGRRFCRLKEDLSNVD